MTKKITYLSLTTAFSITLSGCALPTLQDRTSGEIGCPPEQIMIFDENFKRGWSVNTNTYKAKCGDKSYYCTAQYGDSHLTRCTLAQEAN